MPTGACGVDCDVCKLRLLEICSTCGPGRSREAAAKLEAQKRILGNPCPVLACAAMNQIDFCLRDCTQFPCDNFTTGPYPFSEGFLKMQERRRRESPAARTHNRSVVSIPEEYWEHVARIDLTRTAGVGGVTVDARGGIRMPCFNGALWVDTEGRRIYRRSDDEQWDAVDDALFELVTLLYLMKLRDLAPTPSELVGTGDLKEAHYFKGIHALDVSALLERYGYDLKGFREAALHLGGEPMDMADAAYRFMPFPGVPLYILLWEGDEEFQPKLTVLFERSIERIYSASGIWSLVKVVSHRLLRGPERRIPEDLPKV